MYLPDVLSALRRGWYLLIIGMLMTAGLGLLAAHKDPSYQASEVFAVQPPRLPDMPNQLTGLRPSLATTGAVVAQRLNSPSGRAELRRAGVSGDYSLSPRNSGTHQMPQYIIAWILATATGPDQPSALRSLEMVIDAFSRELVRLQDQWDVATVERITIGVLAAPSAALLPHSALRALIGVGAAGGSVTIALALWWDEWRRRRRGEYPLRYDDPPFG